MALLECGSYILGLVAALQLTEPHHNSSLVTDSIDIDVPLLWLQLKHALPHHPLSGAAEHTSRLCMIEDCSVPIGNKLKDSVPPYFVQNTQEHLLDWVPSVPLAAFVGQREPSLTT